MHSEISMHWRLAYAATIVAARIQAPESWVAIEYLCHIPTHSQLPQLDRGTRRAL